MTSSTPSAYNPDQGFSLIIGGPLYQFFLRSHLAQPPLRLIHRRILACILITWVPMALLSALEGHFYSGVKVSFLSDLGNTRFLIALPILLAAEVMVHRRIRMVVAQFLERELITLEESLRFERLVSRAATLRNSVLAEVLLLVFAVTAGHWVWSKYGSLHMDTWYATPQNSSMKLTWAGYWLVFVSLPIVRFILLRWYFRLFIWYVFLWRVSRLRLQLNALHPDRAGGLGFLSDSISAFTPVLVAQTCYLSAQIGNEILLGQATLFQFKFAIAGFIIFLILSISAPLLFFVIKLLETKIAGSREYGTLASRYVNGFRDKWLEAKEPGAEPVLGTSDIQSLADLANSYEVVRTMRLLPFDRRGMIRLIIALLLPLLPLALTIFSFEEIIQRLFRLLL